MQVHRVGAQDRPPPDGALFQDRQQSPADVLGLDALGREPGARAPVAADVVPEAHGRDAEARVRLDVPGVLVPPHGRQRVLREQLGHPRVEGTHRERVPVEEDDQVVGLGLGGDLRRQLVQFVGMGPVRAGDEVEAPVVAAVLHSLEVGEHPERRVEAGLEVAPLGLDPLRDRPNGRSRRRSCAHGLGRAAPLGRTTPWWRAGRRATAWAEGPGRVSATWSSRPGSRGRRPDAAARWSAPAGVRRAPP